MAIALRTEIENNFSLFEKQWPIELEQAQESLKPARKHFIQSYVGISTIQAWRTTIILGNVGEGAEAFFFEAQNDFLISHCLSRCGSFRQALKALRGAIENVLFCLYYKDHPVELRKWEAGNHRMAFSDLSAYFESHPAICACPQGLQCIGDLKNEYSTLSKAVHGSAVAFRMTQNLEEIRLWGGDVASVGKWSTRERRVIADLNILLCHLFTDKLTGTSNRNLRRTIGLVISKSQQKTLKDTLKITLPVD